MNLLDHYLNYANVNESPLRYHIWSGLSFLSHVIGRRVYTDEELYKVYPNMYVVLAGPPGVAKSTAMDVALDMFKEHFPKLALCPASITKEALIQMLAKKDDNQCLRSFIEDGKTVRFAQMSVFADELVSLITCGGNPTGMIDFMTHIFSCKTYRETTKNKGDNEIQNPYLTILACCTIATLRQLVQSKVISGGMSRRCIFVVEDKNYKPVPRVRRTESQKTSGISFINGVNAMLNLSGRFEWTPEAIRHYDEWYNENFYRGEKTQSEVLQHFLRTKPAYVIKVSMLLAMCEENPRLIHTEETFQKAVDLVTSVENGAQLLFDNAGRNELATIASDVERFIEARKEIRYNEVLKEFWPQLKDGNTMEMEKIISHLGRQGKIIDETKTTGGVGTRYIRWILQK